tara:strand:- start:24 stop:428 length:405 start_codon:yes stop_codon:yes gene_type:complete
MLVNFRFFDKEMWSVFATLQSVIILVIFYLGVNLNKLETLVFASLIAMLQGDLLPKLIFTFFLSLIVWDKKEFFSGVLVTILSVIITHCIDYNNVVHKLFYDNLLLINLVRLSITLWFIYIIYLINKKINFINI